MMPSRRTTNHKSSMFHNVPWFIGSTLRKLQGSEIAGRCGGTAEDSVELCDMNMKRAFGPDHVIGEEHLFLCRKLSGHALIDLFIGPAARPQSRALGLRGTRHADRGVEMTGGVGLEQERDYGDGQGTAFGAPRLQLRLPDRADSRMKNIF